MTFWKFITYSHSEAIEDGCGHFAALQMLLLRGEERWRASGDLHWEELR